MHYAEDHWSANVLRAAANPAVAHQPRRDEARGVAGNGETQSPRWKDDRGIDPDSFMPAKKCTGCYLGARCGSAKPARHDAVSAMKAT
jgi:hypothetical protein